MSTSDSVAMRVCPMAWVPAKSPRPYCPATTPASPRSFDQLERVAERQNLRARHILDEVGELLHVAIMLDAVAIGVFGCILAGQHRDAEALHPLLDQPPTPLDLVMDVEALFRVLLLGHLEAHHIVVAPRAAIKRIAGGVRGRGGAATTASRSFPCRYWPSRRDESVLLFRTSCSRLQSFVHGRQSR